MLIVCAHFTGDAVTYDVEVFIYISAEIFIHDNRGIVGDNDGGDRQAVAGHQVIPAVDIKALPLAIMKYLFFGVDIGVVFDGPLRP